MKATGLLAEALEHEVDHLNGTLYIDHAQGEDRLLKIKGDEQHGTESKE